MTVHGSLCEGSLVTEDILATIGWYRWPCVCGARRKGWIRDPELLEISTGRLGTCMYVFILSPLVGSIIYSK